MTSPSHPLTDSFGRVHSYLRLSLTGDCNLRCRYCMPGEEEGGRRRPPVPPLAGAELERLVRLLARLGVRKLRLTGGEPLMRPELPELVRTFRAIDGIERIGLTTNGVLLEQRLPELQAAGLDSINLSLDTLRPGRFRLIAGRSLLHRVQAGLEAALAAGFRPLKLNTVVIRGLNEDEVPDFVALTRELPLHVRFIEYMPFRANHWRPEGFIPATELRELIGGRWELLPDPGNGEDSGVSRDYRIPGHAGKIGFIAPLSEQFCGDCNRLRLTAAGGLRLCLHEGRELDLAAPLRAGANDEELEALIRQSLLGKWRSHPGLERLHRRPERAMVELGG